jgi:hypothetical protein
MKKFGQICLGILPLLATLGLQQMVVIFLMGLSLLSDGASSILRHGETFYSVFNRLIDVWSSDSFNTAVMIVYAVFCIVLFGMWYFGCYNQSFRPSYSALSHPLIFVGILLLVPGLQYLSTYIVSITASLFPHALEVYEELLETAGLDENITVGMFVYSVLLAPVSEEFMFRGVTLGQLRKALPFWAANLIQAALFGIFHLNLIQGFYAFFLALFLGYLREKSSNLYCSILLHLLFNFWGTVLNEFFPIGDTLFSVLFYFVLAIVLTVGGVVLFRSGIRRAEERRFPTDDFSEFW